MRSKRGVGGGYVLAREPAEITLGEIVSAVDGPIAVGDFGEPHQNGACDHEGQCVLLAVWAGISGRIRAHLDSFTLADIAAMARGEERGPWPRHADPQLSCAPGALRTRPPRVARAHPASSAVAATQGVGPQVKRGTEVGGSGERKSSGSPVTGWSSCQALGVEERPAERQRLAGAVVAGVAHHRMPDRAAGARGSGGCGRSRGRRPAR